MEMQNHELIERLDCNISPSNNTSKLQMAPRTPGLGLKSVVDFKLKTARERQHYKIMGKNEDP